MKIVSQPFAVSLQEIKESKDMQIKNIYYQLRIRHLQKTGPLDKPSKIGSPTAQLDLRTYNSHIRGDKLQSFAFFAEVFLQLKAMPRADSDMAIAAT